jgi:hypothetical protein
MVPRLRDGASKACGVRNIDGSVACTRAGRVSRGVVARCPWLGALFSLAIINVRLALTGIDCLGRARSWELRTPA